VNPQVRRVLSAVLVLGAAGLFVELLLLAHDEDAVQLIPLILLLTVCCSLAVLTLRPRKSAVRALQTTSALMIAAGLLGIVLHFRANMEFQLDIDPHIGRWSLFWKVLQAKAPPALAPGAMVQLGLLGLVLSYRHPALASPLQQHVTI
jgi:hypothetical protein